MAIRTFLNRRQFDIEDYAWDLSSLNEALETLLTYSGFSSVTIQVDAPPAAMDHTSTSAVDLWLSSTLYPLDIEVELLSSTYVEVESMITHAAPCIIQVPDMLTDEETEPQELRYVVLGRSNSNTISLLTKDDLEWRRVPTKTIVEAYRSIWEAPYRDVIDIILRQAGVPEDRLTTARQAMLAEQLRSETISVCTLMQYSPGGNFLRQIRNGNVMKPLVYIFAGFLGVQLLGIVSWVLIGGSALEGYFEESYLLAWALILLTGIPFQLIILWFQNVLSLNFSILFKQRMLFGILQLRPEEIRLQGSGQFLSRVMETESFETLVLNGGFGAVLAIVQVIVAIFVLSAGVAGIYHVALLVVWLLLAILLFIRYVRRSLQWVTAYRGMTNDLVERMVGHRTRLIQELPSEWHKEEDALLGKYLNLSRQMDTESLQLQTFLTRGWLIASLIVLARYFIFDTHSITQLAVTIGGILLASQSFQAFVGGLVAIMNIFISWQEVRPLVNAANRRHPAASVPAIFNTTSTDEKVRSEQPLFVLRDIYFRYRAQSTPIFRDTNLDVHHGERILLEGPSGGGKSTLANLLTSLRAPDSGLIMLNGLDLETIGSAEWRQRVVYVPQFHENHVLNQTFAFNLLMGRGWPPSQEDLEEAEIICRELGLGSLLDRMPSGLQQIVGENGWQLSHGERSRLYIARALLQRSDIIILDESFAALDPETRALALQCVLERAPTLMVIAHP